MSIVVRFRNAIDILAGYAFHYHFCSCSEIYANWIYIVSNLQQPLQDSNLRMWESKSHTLPLGEGAVVPFSLRPQTPSFHRQSANFGGLLGAAKGISNIQLLQHYKRSSQWQRVPPRPKPSLFVHYIPWFIILSTCCSNFNNFPVG